jgi:hypothetical protein
MSARRSSPLRCVHDESSLRCVPIHASRHAFTSLSTATRLSNKQRESPSTSETRHSATRRRYDDSDSRRRLIRTARPCRQPGRHDTKPRSCRLVPIAHQQLGCRAFRDAPNGKILARTHSHRPRLRVARWGARHQSQYPSLDPKHQTYGQDY